MRDTSFRLQAGLLAASAAAILAACGGGGDDDDNDPGPAGTAQITVLSNRADLVSGGDALVAVSVPANVQASDMAVTLNGSNVTSTFQYEAAGNRMVGLVTGLVEGANQVVASGRGRSASLTITNHPRGGPVISGPQLEPWVCATPNGATVDVAVPGTTLTSPVVTRTSGLDQGPTDAKCNAPTKHTYFYQPKAKQGSACTFTTTGADPCFLPYDTAAPPPSADVADFTNDRGATVKSIVRVERGTMNRGIYELVTFHDPAVSTDTPVARQKGWNGKLLWVFGASAAAHRLQAPTTTTTIFNHEALKRGYMVASASLNNNGTNANHLLAAESMMMVKERIVEQYGPIRYTIGSGCSGGSIQQHTIAGSYPGLLDGLQPNCSYQEQANIEIEIKDCGLLADRYYKTANGSTLTTAQKRAIEGHDPAFCTVWINSFLPAYDPTRIANCGPGWPQALTYDPVLRPNGVRCTLLDHEARRLGTFVDSDGARKANKVFDNVGVQYGLKGLQSGAIDVEQFVQLNEGVGSYSPDLAWSGSTGGPPAARVEAQASTLANVYTYGVLSDAKLLAQVAIIDLRGNENPAGDIHANWRSWAMRERLDKANGHHNNQVIWASTPGLVPGAGQLRKSFLTMDAWLANVEADTSSRPRSEKIIANRPLDLGDRCITTPGATDAEAEANVGLGTPACPVTFQGSPRQAAGGPLAEDIFKCQLKPLSFADADYHAKVFTAGQQARLQAVFPSGVCDWTKPGVGQQRSPGWFTFASGTGVALPAPPTSAPL
ncbi:MAG TPA: DUF6351 family protein [Caldimonas sp.]|jgi:hypothetical protein|nr:DUF6351 family protein [Caldimonas sp.]HEX2539907.1 DUF6351 family protein [Caldimonas sp.]